MAAKKRCAARTPKYHREAIQKRTILLLDTNISWSLVMQMTFVRYVENMLKAVLLNSHVPNSTHDLFSFDAIPAAVDVTYECVCH